MRLSTALLQAWEHLEKNPTTTAPAVDCFGKYCEPWSPFAVAWDTVGILEKLYYNTDTGKYNKGYDELVDILRECQQYQSTIKDLPDQYSEMHALWWGSILTAQIDEKGK
jgi:hypothetical protein